MSANSKLWFQEGRRNSKQADRKNHPDTLSVCPRCGAPVYRVRRRFLDRVFSLLWRMQRYRCGNPFCLWEGILSAKNHSETDSVGNGKA